MINILREPKAETCKPDSTSDDVATLFVSYKLNATLRGEENGNPYVQPGDIITIPEADEIYIIGNVYHPQTLAFREDLSISQAIAMVGGPLHDSKTDRVRIVRQQPGGATKTQIFVNLNAIAKNQAEDVVLQPNDVVEVPTSTGKSLMRSLIGTIVPTASQLPYRVIP